MRDAVETAGPADAGGDLRNALSKSWVQAAVAQIGDEVLRDEWAADSFVIEKKGWGAVEKVPLTTIDKLVAELQLDKVDFIKMDIEGAEPNAIQGGRETIRKFQPRMQQLKERYGDDQQKYQAAMMELYKKEKINPAGGCLPILLQMPVFLALYWVLIESVELRQAPWMLWIQDLTARDPFFILPAINMAVMWFTQRLTPMVGVDPIQARMMQMMPLIFGVMFAFFPAGLVLYWVTNGTLGMLQQLWMMRQFGDKSSSTVEKA